ncbi:Alpha/Beta hydrolase protein [Lentinula aff. detonsa]|uniref:Alpha/Beta hydrolase protein n=1 Tax=Lentinula aff. detonsa TaxID=2804958 RepID=A0AA38KX02_9AGAR|nr:Alpha/Beta hydrolase protein [Lentinula aff. detonsa]
MIVLKDIPYHRGPIRDPFREFDLYYQKSSDLALLPLICFVHGGAWRSEDKLDHSNLARNLVSATTIPVIVPNYRLSSGSNDVRHPNHAEDILELLVFITTTSLELPRVFDPSKIYLISHSCGAHMLASIVLDSASIFPTLTPPSTVLNAIQGIILSEGIYDIDRLRLDFPAYHSWFITEAFNDKPSYAATNTTNLRLRSQSNIRWLIIHSKGDTLVNVAQSEAMFAHLQSLYGGLIGQTVWSNTDELTQEHDALLSTSTYLRIVVDFIKGANYVLAA